MPHAISLKQSQIRITPDGGRPVGFDDTVRAVEFLAHLIVTTGLSEVARDASLADPAAHGRPAFRYARFIDQVRTRAVILERVRTPAP